MSEAHALSRLHILILMHEVVSWWVYLVPEERSMAVDGLHGRMIVVIRYRKAVDH